MAPAKSKGLVPSISSSVRTRHPVLGVQPASHSLYNACSQGEQQTFCLNSSHPRAGSCLPETAPKKKIIPRESNIHPDRRFLINTPELGLNSNTKAIVGEHGSCRTHAELSHC